MIKNGNENYFLGSLVNSISPSRYFERVNLVLKFISNELEGKSSNSLVKMTKLISKPRPYRSSFHSILYFHSFNFVILVDNKYGDNRFSQ